jgi:hypothetical protein
VEKKKQTKKEEIVRLNRISSQRKKNPFSKGGDIRETELRYEILIMEFKLIS